MSFYITFITSIERRNIEDIQHHEYELSLSVPE